MSDNRYYYTELSNADSVSLQIDGVDYDVASVTTNFAINSIPDAICALATGRRAANTDIVSNVHLNSATWTKMMPATIKFKPGQTSEKWPDGEQIIFKGYFTGFGYRKIRGEVQLTVHLIHQLFDLARSSSLSVDSSPTSPGYLAAPAICSPDASTAGSGLDNTNILSSFVGSYTVPDMFATDVWGALKTFLSYIAKKKGFAPTCSIDSIAGSSIINLQQNDNVAVLAALNLIEGPDQPGNEGPGKFTLDGSGGYKYAKATKFNNSLEGISKGIADAVGRVATVAVWGETLWDLLVKNFASEFLFIVCPGIDRTIVIPDMPTYSGDVWRTLSANEYDYVDQSSSLSAPIRGVISYGSSMSQNGLNSNSPSDGSAIPGSCFAGYFAPSNVAGVLDWVPAPSWLQGMIYSGVNAGGVTGIATQQPPNTATTAGAATAPATDTSPAALTDQVMNWGVLSYYSQAVYYREVLRGRAGTVSGKLRFDIGPGSQVMIEGSPEKFIGDSDQLAGNIYGQVARVSCSIDAEGKRASTSFQVIYHRGATENKDPNISTKTHPFFSTGVVNGFPLSKAFDLGNNDDDNEDDGEAGAAGGDGTDTGGDAIA